MPHRTLPPRRVYRAAVVTTAICTPLSFITLGLWVAGVFGPDQGDTVGMMFSLFLNLAITSGAVAGIAAAYSAVHAAFAAGFQIGQASVDPRGPDPLPRLRKARQQGEPDPLLKLVE